MAARPLRAPSDDGAVQDHRRSLYEHAARRVNRALREGFWVEAIALEEAMISDRLESLLSVSLKRPQSFETLGPLLRALRKASPALLDEELLNDLDAWRQRRNAAVHQMVKVPDGDTKGWAHRLRDARAAAEEGKLLFRRLDAALKRAKRRAV